MENDACVVVDGDRNECGDTLALKDDETIDDDDEIDALTVVLSVAEIDTLMDGSIDIDAVSEEEGLITNSLELAEALTDTDGDNADTLGECEIVMDADDTSDSVADIVADNDGIVDMNAVAEADCAAQTSDM